LRILSCFEPLKDADSSRPNNRFLFKTHVDEKFSTIEFRRAFLAFFLLTPKNMHLVLTKMGEIRLSRQILGIIATVTVCACGTFLASADQSATVGWNADSNVSGYYFYYGQTNGNYSTKLNVGTNTVTTVSNLKEGQTYYFAVSAFDTAGIESDLSSSIGFLVPGVLLATPGSATDPIQLRFPVAPSHSYEVQASEDLVSWTSIWQSTATSNAWVNFSDPQNNVLSKRFYKLVSY
jgi:hypothetical protein